MPKEAIKKTGLTPEQVEQLKSTGRLSGGSKVAKKLQTITGDIEYVLNLTNRKIMISDLMLTNDDKVPSGIAIGPNELVYLLSFAEPAAIKRSKSLMNAVLFQGVLKIVKDPSEVTVEQMTPKPPLGERLGRGEYVDNRTNPYDAELDRVDAEEESYNAAQESRVYRKRVKRVKGKKSEGEDGEVQEPEMQSSVENE